MESKKLAKPRKNGAFSTRQAVMKLDEETGGVFPTMKPLDTDKKAEKAISVPAAAPVQEKIDFSNVKIEPIFKDMVDFDTFSKSDFRAVKVKECEAVKKSKKLLKFVLDDGTGTDRVILSGIHEYLSRKNWWARPALPLRTCRPAR